MENSIKDIATIKSSEISTSLELRSLSENIFRYLLPVHAVGGEGRETQENKRQDGWEVKQRGEDEREIRGASKRGMSRNEDVFRVHKIAPF